MPTTYKLCSFNCVYCHYGLTDVCTADLSGREDDLPSVDEVVTALEQALRKPTELDLITFSGNGEPTLYPRFPELVGAVADLRDAYKPLARVALLSNAAGLVRDEVRGSLSRVDLPVLKLDAGTERTFRAINRPAKGIRFREIVDRLIALDNIYLQTVLLDGTPSNVNPAELDAYFELLRQIRPLEVHMYSIDRPVPDAAISLVPPDRLEEIADQASRETGVPVRAFYAGGQR
ncbi:MAG TPA: radical SAM protein [Acidobacteriota bacterium]|nr:radical SAM protein [Acidobacteriota bacterium]